MAQSQSLLDALYCEEEHWEEVREDYFGEEERESYYIDDITPNPLPLLEQDLFWEEEELASLLSKEQPNPSYNYFETNPSLDFARREAIEWVLKVNAYFSFSVHTAVLAVNYFDRFVFSFQFQREKPWMSQLAAVACLSLAAKVEETQVPLLLDLQVEETKYVFEAKTIQRMEILVLSTLQWKMNPATPLSFLDHITRRLGFKNNLCWEFLRRCESLILCLVSDSRFMCYLPSVLASATMLHTINSIEPCFALDCQNQLLGTLGIDKGKVEDCYKLILESESTLSHRSNKRKFGLGSMPGSPNGVMDVCFSSDSSNDSWAVAASVSSSPEPKKKKICAQDFEAEDVLSSPR
ncbi:Cyclin-D3-1 like [Actinidia chinensis var. chinensis]|uniref:Cyclin-D3-1 like n=1 Tax=Actinidia chinensis var. chinensis TaxID=1590841 RepID=A0A2R6QY06_ACTCC|nr:Cyclin-D3-1 like [Actinidia chinensis var. chinensis]